ncbi:MAG: hypothetical protein K6B68_12640 [Eubacterium sp.]|nr:hypothetical protein [Eubacterium sp.]
MKSRNDSKMVEVLIYNPKSIRDIVRALSVLLDRLCAEMFRFEDCKRKAIFNPNRIVRITIKDGRYYFHLINRETVQVDARTGRNYLKIYPCTCIKKINKNNIINLAYLIYYHKGVYRFIIDE